MFINVIQKAQPLFKDYPQVESFSAAKKMALANPIFSWHVKYLTHKRKKLVIFTNDASTLTVVIDDVNAKNRSQLKEMFESQLKVVWKNLGLDLSSLKEYLEVGGEWQIGKSVNRSQLGRLTDVGVILNYDMGIQPIDDKGMSISMTALLRSLPSGDTAFRDDIIQLMQSKNLRWNDVPDEEDSSVDTAHLKDIRQQLEALEKSFSENMFTTDLSKIDQKVQKISKLNNELIDIFVESIKDDYSEKTLKSYRGALQLYLNQFLAYRFKTIFNVEASSVGELYSHGSSMTETKRVQRTLSRFYKFLADEDVVDVKFAKEMKSNLKSDIEKVEEGFYGDFYY